MAFKTAKTTLLGPSTIAVDYDSNMPGQHSQRFDHGEDSSLPLVLTIDLRLNAPVVFNH
jgi:hypothetical protein